MKKTYNVPAIEICELESINMIAESIPVDKNGTAINAGNKNVLSSGFDCDFDGEE